MTTRKFFEDLDFYVIAEPSSHYVSFKIYDVGGFTMEGKPLFDRAGSDTFDPVETPEESEPFAHGGVKWDGCSNWHFDECERVMIHGCSRGSLTRIGEILGACWDMAGELMESWNPC